MIVYRPRGVVEGLKAALLRTSLKLLLKPVFSPRRSIAFQRRWLLGLSRSTPIPAGMSIEAGQIGGVPGEWLRSMRAPSTPAGVVLYLHGGAHCVGSPATHRSLTARLAQVTGLPVFALDHRLAPEHRFPAALDDAVAAFRALHAEGHPVVLAGDSAGGGLALATALALRDGGSPRPAALVLFSPWVDLTMRDAPATEPPARRCSAGPGPQPAPSITWAAHRPMRRSPPRCSPTCADCHQP